MNHPVIVFTDLGFGDNGKGTTIDWFARIFSQIYGSCAVVRFQGGSNAGHGVVTSDGRYHIYSQLGSGTFVPGVETFLSRFMLVDPWRLIAEERHLQECGVTDALDRLAISQDAMVVSPFHGAANRLRELARADARHGSCGLGIGETMQDFIADPQQVLRVSELKDPKHLFERLRTIQHRKREQLYEEGIFAACWNQPEARKDIAFLLDDDAAVWFVTSLKLFNEKVRVVADSYLGELLKRGPVLFEPSQGVLLDESRGFDPYTTWSNCTSDNADVLLAEQNYQGEIQHIGILRAYGVRHGPGPFPTEDEELTSRLPDPPSARNNWQGQFRVGHFDAVLARYAIACCKKIDSLVITCLDRLETIADWQICMAYQEEQQITSDLLPSPYKDLDYQRTLTQRLFHVCPQLETTTRASDFETRAQEHVARISSELGLPISLLSFGSTADDKRLH